MMSPLTSPTSRDAEQTDLSPGIWLPCTRTAAQDFKTFLSGAFTEANVKTFSFFEHCLIIFSSVHVFIFAGRTSGFNLKKDGGRSCGGSLQWGQDMADAEPVLL